MVDDDEVLGARVVLLDVVSARKAQGRRGFDFSRSDAAVLRYPWAAQEVPVPGLLDTLESVGKERTPVYLKDLAAAAAKFKEPPFQLLEPVLHLAGLGQLAVAGKAP